MKGLGLTLINGIFHKNRDKGGTQRTFCKKASQQVRYSKGCNKGIGAESGPKKPCNHRIANKTQDTACQRCSADDTSSFYDPVIFRHGLSLSINFLAKSAKILDMAIIN